MDEDVALREYIKNLTGTVPVEGETMSNPIVLSERELKEIELCMHYAENLRHGTAGHNRMLLIADLAHANGFILRGDDLTVPDNVTVEGSEKPT